MIDKIKLEIEQLLTMKQSISKLKSDIESKQKELMKLKENNSIDFDIKAATKINDLGDAIVQGALFMQKKVREFSTTKQKRELFITRDYRAYARSEMMSNQELNQLRVEAIELSEELKKKVDSYIAKRTELQKHYCEVFHNDLKAKELDLLIAPRDLYLENDEIGEVYKNIQ